MKIAIKKKYILYVSIIICAVLTWNFLNEILRLVSHEPITILIAPIIFLVSLIYIIQFAINWRFNDKLAEEVGRKSFPNDSQKAKEIKNHLFNKSFEESYTLNFSNGKLSFTTSWSSQKTHDEIDQDFIYNLRKADRDHKSSRS